MPPSPVSTDIERRTLGLVSIVTPTLNAEEFIEAAIVSLRDQTYGAIEHIVVDGGSTDATLQIARRYADFLRIVHAPGLNQAAAINVGFRESSGEFFGFLNADDTLSPTALASAVACLRGSPGSAVAYGKADHIDSSGKVVSPYPVGIANRATLARECVICQPATLMRSRAFDQVGGLDESLNFALDYDLWIRLLVGQYGLTYVPEVWAQSRMHRANKTLGQRAAGFKEVFQVLRSHFGYVPFNWIHAYAGYLVDGRDHFFELPTGTPMRAILTLTLGLRENLAKPLAFLSEYTSEMIRLHTKR